MGAKLGPNENQEHALQESGADCDAKLHALISAWNACEAEIGDVRERHREPIREALNAYTSARADLHNAIAASADSLWARTKTRVAGLVRFGWRKARGKVVIADEQMAVAKLRQLLPPRSFEGVAKTETKLVKDNLRRLKAGILAKAGVQLTDDVDEIVVDGTTEAKKTLKLLIADGWRIEDEEGE